MRAKRTQTQHGTWPAVVVWALGWAALLALDGHVNLANLALILVATAALATRWLSAWASAGGALLAVIAFNWSFVPPRYSFSVDLQQHAVLLATMVIVVWTVAALVARQRQLAQLATQRAEREEQLRVWSDALRDAQEPASLSAELQATLQANAATPVILQITAASPWAPSGTEPASQGQPARHQLEGLDLCAAEARAMGPGTGRHDEQPDLYLPLRSGVPGRAMGAALFRGWRAAHPEDAKPPITHLQALCDRFGEALHRHHVALESQQLRDAAQDHATRSALLAAIAHDHRTPLATILGAASTLVAQDSRLEPAQRQRLAQGIVDEAERLARITDNTLQLARLAGQGVSLRRDWESAEELIGAALARADRRGIGRATWTEIPAGLPWLWCDALLVSQLLDNLLDNADKYSAPDKPITVKAQVAVDRMVLTVQDGGPPISPDERERIFNAFHRGPQRSAGSPQGAGLGLTVCRAIARAHGGDLQLRQAHPGGNAFECSLPLYPQPQAPQA